VFFASFCLDMKVKENRRIFIDGNGNSLCETMKQKKKGAITSGSGSGSRRLGQPSRTTTYIELVIGCQRLNPLLIEKLIDILHGQGPKTSWKLVELWNSQSSCAIKILKEISTHRNISQFVLHNVSKPTLEYIATWLRNSKLPSMADIEQLRICKVHDFSIQVAKTFGDSLIDSTLLRLELLNVSFPSLMIVETLAGRISQHNQWQLLSFDSCCLEDVEVATVVRALQSARCAVEELCFPSNYCQEQGTIAITHLLQDSSIGLKRLDLSNQDVWDDRKYMMHMIQHGITNPQCCLEQLRMESNFIDDTFFTTLIQALAHNANSCLRELMLRNNRISDIGIETLSPLLTSLSLVSLDLRENLYSSRSVVDLSISMCHQWTLQNFQIDHLSDAPLIPFYTALNKAGRDCQRDINLPLGLLPLILHRCEKPEIVMELPSRFESTDLLYAMMNHSYLVQRP